MKRTQFKKAVALLLLGSMMSGMAVSADAAWFGGSSKKTEEFYKSWDAQLRDFLAEKQNNKNNKPGQNKKPDKENNGNNNPGQENNTDSAGSSTVIESEMTVVEDATTVENGEMLRASTYVLNSVSGSNAELYADGEVTLKYFPITMYNYDADTINAATHRMEVDQELKEQEEWQGIYFSNGSPAAEGFTYTTSVVAHTNLTWAQVMNGTYYYDEACTTAVTVTAITSSGTDASSIYVEAEDVTFADLISYDSSVWVRAGEYYHKSGNNYYPIYVKRSLYTSQGYDYYRYQIGYGNSTDDISVLLPMGSSSGNCDVYYLYTDDKVADYYSNNIDFYTASGDVDPVTGYKLTAGGTTLATLDGTDTSAQVDVTLYSPAGTQQTLTLPYAGWNHWDKTNDTDTGNTGGQKFYTGLVESELTANKDIVFTKPEGGIFNSDTTVKNIYTNVQLPFVYADQTYTFDASENGVYFYEDATQGSSGTPPASNTRLYFNFKDSPDEINTQSNGGSYGDGSTTVWAPYNNGTSFSEADMDYHFGMRTTIPFSMTTNGRLQETNDKSEAIHFSFSGDDDVWVFIDGHLVIDLGGIHNRLDAVIDFAANTVTYSASNDAGQIVYGDFIRYATGSFNNNENFALTQALFENLIPQDRATFAATDSHELTIFYLERGAGSSNCKIEFNLPMKDTVTVTKHATQAWTADGTTDGILSALTDAEQAIVNNIDFGFTLYKSVNASEFSTVANTKYLLLNENGQVIDNPSTDANGHFYLKNGQSARFITVFEDADGYAYDNGITYYVVEDKTPAGFLTPDFTFGGVAAGRFKVGDTPYDKAEEIPEQVLPVDAPANKSYEITVFGAEESEDSVVFVCENFLDAKLPNPAARPVEDKIVIDYGLGVEIDVLANDLYRGDVVELIYVNGAGVTLNEDGTFTNNGNNNGNAPVYGTAKMAGGKITYQLNKQLTGVEVLNYVIKVTGSTTNESTDITATAHDYGVGTVYIIPATTMYYEEDFSDMVTYRGIYWQGQEGTESNTYQEPGVVGTVGDSPYGSDIAYLDDSGDSNGTSYYADTTNGAVAFSYTFTGTGTSFYARTSGSSGYMRVEVVNNANNEKVDYLYRNTCYISGTNDTIDPGTLYNIPVYSTGNLSYGTYTVTVTVYKANEDAKIGKDFWLDGIRIYSPLLPNDANIAVANAAYSTDGEANMTHVTLREKLLSDTDIAEDGKTPVWKEGGNFVLFTDIDNGLTTAEKYKSIGPKEEVYLYGTQDSPQTVTFSLTNWDTNSNKVYLGMKAPTGSANVTVGSTNIALSNTVDCFYDISNYAAISSTDGITDGIKNATFTIRAGSGDLVSLTTIKVTGDAEFTIVVQKDGFVDDDSFEDPR